MDKKFVIFAPHIDDELIGCFTYLKTRQVSKVFFFYDLTADRKAEARRVADAYEFEAIFADEYEWHIPVVPEDAIILAPNRKDAHPHHRAINSLCKIYNNKKMYYSVDMNHKTERLDPQWTTEKYQALVSFYRSQRSLFENDAKYYLFQSVQPTDGTTTVWVTFQKEGIHQYPDAPDKVAYLRNAHRHVFHFNIEIEVFGDDREIEFIMLKHELQEFVDLQGMNNKSCEMLARDIEQYLWLNYNDRQYKITVSEDGENGATVYSGDFLK